MLGLGPLCAISGHLSFLPKVGESAGSGLALASPEGEGISLHAGIEKLNLEGAVFDLMGLPHELI